MKVEINSYGDWKRFGQSKGYLPKELPICPQEEDKIHEELINHDKPKHYNYK